MLSSGTGLSQSLSCRRCDTGGCIQQARAVHGRRCGGARGRGAAGGGAALAAARAVAPRCCRTLREYVSLWVTCGYMLHVKSV